MKESRRFIRSLPRSVYCIPLIIAYAQFLSEAEGSLARNATSVSSCNGGAPWFGATPPSREHRAHRRGWEACARCGGAERLGARLDDVGPLQRIDNVGAADVIDAVRAHGVVVIPGQNLTRAEQVAFTAKLGEPIVLPPSMEGKDPEPGQPAIQRISNFWSSGEWKGPNYGLGEYWHQDGQFHASPRHNVLSLLHAQKVPVSGGETGFADLRAARHTLSKPLLERARNLRIEVSVRDIRDFAEGTEEDLAMFPEAQHPLLRRHVLDGGDLLYLGSPHCRVGGLDTPEAGKELLLDLFRHATSPSFTYYHAWEAGDVVVWDNTQTLHHAMPYENDGTVRRELYRTQAHFALTECTGNREEL